MAVLADPDDAALRRYLLGLLPEAEADAVEEAYFVRPDVLERVRGVEHDLLDDYAAGQLEPGEKAAFESRYLASSSLRERVEAARALRLATADKEAPARVVVRPVRWRVPLAIAAGLLLVVLAFWIRPPRPSQLTSASLPSAAPSESPLPPSAASGGPALAPSATAPSRQPPMSRAVVFALSPVLLRGQGRPAQLRLTEGTDVVVLELEGDSALLPPSPSELEAVIKTVEGEEVWRGEARHTRDAARPSLLAFTRVPAKRLAPGDYLLTLSGQDADEGTLYSYFLRVGYPRQVVSPGKTP
jgi:hypothetical protein